MNIVHARGVYSFAAVGHYYIRIGRRPCLHHLSGVLLSRIRSLWSMNRRLDAGVGLLRLRLSLGYVAGLLTSSLSRWSQRHQEQAWYQQSSTPW